VKYLLDTTTCTYIINKKPPAVVTHIKSKQPDEIAISTITIAELECGVYRSRHADQNRIALLEFLVPITILDFDESAAAIYGSIKTSLEAKGTLIGTMDLLLAAQAISKNLILVTNNEREFRRVESLRLVNWTVRPSNASGQLSKPLDIQRKRFERTEPI
jgi:tRNA(fMet)-specific endonuclease VapC